MASVVQQFDAAVKVVQCMPKDGPFQPSYEMKKRFYGLYKQAVKGPCNEPKPAFWEAIKRAKWEAWNQLGDMSQEEAMNGYVTDLLKVMKKNRQSDRGQMTNIVETMPINDEVSAFLEALGPFFESVNEPSPIPEEKWPQHSSKTTNGQSPIKPVNGDMHTEASRGELNNGGVAGAVSVNRPEQSDGPAATLVTVTMKGKGNNDPGPNGDAFADRSHPFLGDVSGNFSPDVTPDLTDRAAGRRTDGADADPAASSEEETDSEDFCDSTDQPDQLPGLIRHPSLSSDSFPEVVGDFVGQGAAVRFRDEPVQVSAPSDSEGLENGDSEGMWHSRGGGEVVPGGRHRLPRRVLRPLDYSASMRASRGEGQSSQGADRSAHGGQGGAPGGREPPFRGQSQAVGDVSEQIAKALFRLQCDVSRVLARLNNLETLALFQAQQNQSERQSPPPEGRRPETRPPSRSWLAWLFPRNLPGRTIFFLLVWPLIVNVVVAVWRRRRHRHLRR